MEKIDQLKRRRTTLKRSIGRINDYISGQNVANHDGKVRVDELEEIYKQYKDIQSEIDLLCETEDDLEKEELCRNETEDMYFRAKSKARSLVQDIPKNSVLETGATSTHTIANNDNQELTTLLQTMTTTLSTVVQLQSSSSSSKSEFRMPTIEIPEFNGDYSSWTRFKDLFTALVDSKTSFSGVEKLEFLQSKLKGEALSTIKHLTPTNDNYRIAWDLIDKKFNRPSKIKETFLKLMLDQPSVKNGDLAELKRLYSNTSESYNALKVHYDTATSWDPILLYIIKGKLDKETLTHWYREQKDDSQFQDLLDFLEKRVNELDDLQGHNETLSYRKSKTVALATKGSSCQLCDNDHYLYGCQLFRNMSVEERKETVRKSGLCFNCLREKHFSKNCKFSSCKTCGLKHNTLLHVDESDLDAIVPSSSTNSTNPTTITINSSVAKKATLLPTAIIMVRDVNNKLQPCRALLDTGADSSLISECCVQRLGLRKFFDNTLLYGINDTPSYTKGKVQMEIFAQKKNLIIKVNGFCLSKLTHFLPTSTILGEKAEFFKSLKLADPEYYVRNRIDIILGADVYPYCMLDKRITHPSDFPTAFETIFGFVIMGRTETQPSKSITIAHCCTALDSQLKRFWETEECNSEQTLFTPEEEKAEQHYKANVERQQDGRYLVRLPFKYENVEFGESKKAAIRRLTSMERQFDKNNGLKEQFHKFMDEYIQLQHMEVIYNIDEQDRYYMPHHAVLKPSSSTTKLRVVFDASCKTSNNKSLNDQLLVGPTIQRDLFTILLNFRKYEVGFCADIEKMYRQILIHPLDRKYQSIVWRNSTDQVPSTFELKTVTYGTKSAPFLATRTLKQVAIDNSTQNPDVSREILENFYVDDYMSCAPNVEIATRLHKGICSVLNSSGFNLRKWCTNSKLLYEVIRPEDRSNCNELAIDNSETVKTLGLLWNTDIDCFQYSVSLQLTSSPFTKRGVLSDISKIYDPIGWLAPVVVKLKIFMQKLWLRGLRWDQVLPADLNIEWNKLQRIILNIKDITIPRWFKYNEENKVELHGFADASELAYAAAVYVRVFNGDGSISTALLSAKTRVAPIQQITLPRLELCAVQLVTKLMIKVKKAMGFEDANLYGWTDSTVVLSWLNDHPRRWKTFIANRTSYVLNVIPSCQWRHINSKDNPADLATRGISSSELIHNQLWWLGPRQILEDSIQEFQTIIIKPNNVDLEERKSVTALVASTRTEIDLLHKFSDYNKLLRVTALILRFIKNCKDKQQRKFGFLSTVELRSAQQKLIKISQLQSFTYEIKVLAKQNQLPTGNKLSSLTPFLDKDGILRVGGRLENALISYDQKHPYILHKDNALTKMIVRDYHFKYLHAGTRQLQYLLALKYWIPNVAYLMKRTVYKCTKCMRFRQRPLNTLMGNLPKCRLQPASTFLYVGIDFAGPMLIKSWKGRGAKIHKCWIAVFVCLNTKAMHLEAVTELSTQAFLASLRRFVSRRGKPLHIYTDNGSNFVGCNQELKDLYQFLTSNQASIRNEMTKEEIQWHFMPPSAPNFGGVWEAGVKSMKHHLKRVLGSSSVTYEELNTLLCQIECCLNSRPICLKFEGDEDPLTPGHFLIFRPMSSVPDEDLIDINVSRLSRWQYLQSIVQMFWSKWSKEYLTQLQKRPKWLQKIENLKLNDVIIIKEDNLPPTQWLLGKIVATHPGTDGIVRVVSVKTKNGVLKRPISKICPLLMDD